MDRISHDVDAANVKLHHIDPVTAQPIYHAVFVRDSLERSLSAFLDKCIQSQWTARFWCQPQSHREFGRYSHFDIFVEAVLSKAQKPDNEFLAKQSFWQLDYHWLPQNWVCDLYKLIDRYHIYNADNITERKRFFLDIGGTEFNDFSLMSCSNVIQ